jgi:intergrase/recombinase
MNNDKKLYPDIDMEFVDVLDYFDSSTCGTLQGMNDVCCYTLPWKSAVAFTSFHPMQLGYDAFLDDLLESL